MPSNTKYNPVNNKDFDKSKLQFDGQGVSTTIIAGNTANLDFTLTDDCLLTGLEFITSGFVIGDYVNLQVVDTTGITGYPPGTVLIQVASNWFVNPGGYDQYDIVYPAKIIAGLTLRVVYHSTGLLNSVFLAMNYKLHKVLV